MSKKPLSQKHLQIEQNNTFMFIVLGVAAAILSFTIVSSISLGARLSYQSRVINERAKAEKQLKANKDALQSLISSYESFDSASESVLGTADKNSKIVLDALPSKYDFPALAASIEKIINITGGIQSFGINGSDLEATATQSSIDPKPINIPITVAGNASYENIQKLVANLQFSIRPFKVVELTLNGNQNNMSFSIELITYYMPEKNLEIPLREIK